MVNSRPWSDCVRSSPILLRPVRPNTMDHCSTWYRWKSYRIAIKREKKEKDHNQVSNEKPVKGQNLLVIRSDLDKDNFLTYSQNKIWAGARLNQQNDVCAQWIQIRLSIHQSDQSLLCALLIAKGPKFLHTISKDWSECMDVQVDRRFPRPQRLFCWLCHAPAEILQVALPMKGLLCVHKKPVFFEILGNDFYECKRYKFQLMNMSNSNGFMHAYSLHSL